MDLSNSQNWLLITSQSKRVTQLPSTNPSKGKYIPLEPSEIQVSSPVLLIDLQSTDALPYWIRGGWCSLFGKVNGIQSLIGQKKLRLFENNLIEFPFFGEEMIPFTIRIEYPWWIKDVSFTLWEFHDSSGRYLSSNIERSLSDLENKLEGEIVALQPVSSESFKEGEKTLYRSVFEGNTKYVNYELGRFKSDNKILSDPIVQLTGNKFTATFTSNEVLASKVTVVVRPTS